MAAPTIRSPGSAPRTRSAVQIRTRFAVPDQAAGYQAFESAVWRCSQLHYTYNPNTQTATINGRWTKNTLDAFGCTIEVDAWHIMSRSRSRRRGMLRARARRSASSTGPRERTHWAPSADLDDIHLRRLRADDGGDAAGREYHHHLVRVPPDYGHGSHRQVDDIYESCDGQPDH